MNLIGYTFNKFKGKYSKIFCFHIENMLDERRTDESEKKKKEEIIAHITTFAFCLIHLLCIQNK